MEREDWHGFRRGDLVEARGLTAAALNGQQGTVDGLQGLRLTVQFGELHGLKALKPENLWLVRATRAEAASDADSPDATPPSTSVRRPAQLRAACSSGSPLSRPELVRLYLEDVSGGGLVLGQVPARPREGGLLRIAQWNVNCFRGPGTGQCRMFELRRERQRRMFELLLSFDSDVLVLQEWSWDGRDLADALLREAGYELMVDEACIPTMLALRCRQCRLPAGSAPEGGGVCAALSPARSLRLDAERAASNLLVRLVTGEAISVYSTHLHYKNFEMFPGRVPEEGMRAKEAGVMLADVAAQQELPTVVVADWNQPRQRDYLAEEWACIARSAQARSEPEDDGVCSLFEAQGFVCSLDQSSDSLRNWPREAPPPPTHWTGTAVDYSFARGVRLHGNYILPSSLSDHFPVVSDWIL